MAPDGGMSSYPEETSPNGPTWHNAPYHRESDHRHTYREREEIQIRQMSLRIPVTALLAFMIVIMNRIYYAAWFGLYSVNMVI